MVFTEKSIAGDNEVVEPQNTWIHEIFQGVLTNETQCLSCETIRSKDEDFLDLSIDLEQNTSITQCLKYINNVLCCLCAYNILSIECSPLQKCFQQSASITVNSVVASKKLLKGYKLDHTVIAMFGSTIYRLRVKKLPKILALHLKRFKYMETIHRYVKLSYRVPFPWELKLFNTVSACNKNVLSKEASFN